MLETGGGLFPEDEEGQAEVEMWKYVFGFVEMAAVRCGVELGIADLLEREGRPMNLAEMSEALGCHPPTLLRVMRFLVHIRIFKEVAMHEHSMGYAQTALSRRLMVGKGDKSMAAFLLLESSRPMLSAWDFLSSRVLAMGDESSFSPFESANEDNVWAYAAARPPFARLIDDAMACHANALVPSIIKGCSDVFHGIGVLVDVGGGNGTALRMLLHAFSSIRGINFDLPHVAAAAPEVAGVQNIGGDMFRHIPPADAAFLMWVLHDWGDDECVQILEKCKVIIVETVVGEHIGEEKVEGIGLMLDMVMLAHTKQGMERTWKEWNRLLQRAGFTRSYINRIPAVQSVIVAYA